MEFKCRSWKIMETNELNNNFILEQYYTLQCSMICDIIPSCLILGIGYRVLINNSALLGIFFTVGQLGYV